MENRLLRGISRAVRLGLPLALVLALAGAAGVASAEQWSVQIGAFEQPDPKFSEAAEKIGKLYRSRNRDGLIRIQVGRYATEREAAIARTALLGAGYADAFVVKKGVAAYRPGDTTGARAAAPLESSVGGGTTVVSPSGDPLAEVPLELRDQVVLLDGRLHVVDGEEFIPYQQYLRSQAR